MYRIQVFAIVGLNKIRKYIVRVIFAENSELFGAFIHCTQHSKFIGAFVYAT